jgi:uncharacterized protein (TIGR02266 family)
MENERRAHPRFPLILAVQYLGPERVLDYTENLSSDGLFIRTEREFAAGERVTLVVSFPQLVEPVELEVEVVRRREVAPGTPAGVAVRVPDDRPEERAKLAEISRAVAGALAPSPTLRILLVEDSALVAAMYAAALRRLSDTDRVGSIGIETASDGREALERLLRSPPIDVIVTDVFMPVVSGITLVERIRAEPALARLPVVVISSGGEREREKLAALGVTTFLRKPVSYEALASAIRCLLPGAPARAAPVPVGEGSGEALTGDDGVRMDTPYAIPAPRR